MIKALLLHILCIVWATTIMAQKETAIFTEAEQMPYFSGCDKTIIDKEARRLCSNEKLKSYLQNNLIYPAEAQEDNIEGVVYLRFVIDVNGKVIFPQILKDIGGGCGMEALKTIQNMPDWEPAIHRGKKVKVALELPIHFYFKEEHSNSTSEYRLLWGQLKEYTVTKKVLRKNLSTPIKVINSAGVSMNISQLDFSVSKKNRVLRKSSKGVITPSMEKLIRKLRKDDLFLVSATVQEQGKFKEVTKGFQISKH